MQSIHTFLTLVSAEFCCSFGEIWPPILDLYFSSVDMAFNFPSTRGILEASTTAPESFHLPPWSTPHSLPEWLVLKLSTTVYGSAWIYPSCCISITTLVKLWPSNAFLSSPSTPLPVLSLHPAVPSSWNSLLSLHLAKDCHLPGWHPSDGAMLLLMGKPQPAEFFPTLTKMILFFKIQSNFLMKKFNLLSQNESVFLIHFCIMNSIWILTFL